MAERQQDQETGGEYCGTGRYEELLLGLETVRQGDRVNYTGLGDSKTRRQEVSIGEQGEKRRYLGLRDMKSGETGADTVELSCTWIYIGGV